MGFLLPLFLSVATLGLGACSSVKADRITLAADEPNLVDVHRRDLNMPASYYDSRSLANAFYEGSNHVLYRGGYESRSAVDMSTASGVNEFYLGLCYTENAFIQPKCYTDSPSFFVEDTFVLNPTNSCDFLLVEWDDGDVTIFPEMDNDLAFANSLFTCLMYSDTTNYGIYFESICDSNGDYGSLTHCYEVQFVNDDDGWMITDELEQNLVCTLGDTFIYSCALDFGSSPAPVVNAAGYTLWASPSHLRSSYSADSYLLALDYSQVFAYTLDLFDFRGLGTAVFPGRFVWEGVIYPYIVFENNLDYPYLSRVWLQDDFNNTLILFSDVTLFKRDVYMSSVPLSLVAYLNRYFGLWVAVDNPASVVGYQCCLAMSTYNFDLLSDYQFVVGGSTYNGYSTIVETDSDGFDETFYYYSNGGVPAGRYFAWHSSEEPNVLYPVSLSRYAVVTAYVGDGSNAVCPWYRALGDFRAADYGDYQNAYSNGYSNGEIVGYDRGWEDGREDGLGISDEYWNQGYVSGLEVGYNSGYQDGLEVGASGDVTHLFGAVVDVPINILNGLSPLVIWDTPIISIILSFLFVGIALWVVKKVI